MLAQSAFPAFPRVSAAEALNAKPSIRVSDCRDSGLKLTTKVLRSNSESLNLNLARPSGRLRISTGYPQPQTCIEILWLNYIFHFWGFSNRVLRIRRQTERVLPAWRSSQFMASRLNIEDPKKRPLKIWGFGKWEGFARICEFRLLADSRLEASGV